MFNGWCKGSMPEPTGRLHCISKPDGGYRPILIQCTLWNIFQNVLKNRLTAIVPFDVLYSTDQYGYRTARSSVDCLDDILKKCKEIENPRVLSLDASKAFDRILRSAIVDELTAIDMPDNLRTAIIRCVEAGCRVTNLGGLRTGRGIPQGAVLSGILYNIGMRRFPSNPKVCSFRYADDTNLICEFGDSITPYLDEVTAFHTARGVDLNPNKFQEAVRSSPPIKLLGKMITTERILAEEVPEPHRFLKNNYKLSAYHKVQVYRQTTLAKWAYALECSESLDLQYADQKAKQRVRQLLSVPRNVSTDKLISITGNSFLPSFFLTRAAQRRSDNTGGPLPTWAQAMPSKRNPHALFSSVNGVYLLKIATGRVASKGPCPLCRIIDGNTVDHV
eukprot:Lankesteria_metandrocarpae@DN5492_c0_g1_i5.p2